MTLMGLVTTYQGLVVARFFLGLTEAGFFPAATYCRLPLTPPELVIFDQKVLLTRYVR